MDEAPRNTILQGDSLALLRRLPSRSVQCCVTSPPYFGLRDYGVPGQIGLEPTLAGYLDVMIAVFDEVFRVLRTDGTLWLNLGDSYVGSADMRGGPPSASSTLRGNGHIGGGPKLKTTRALSHSHRDGKPKDLMGIPWRVAFALQEQGWYLRSDIVWSKPNPMPESVTDRPTRSHEYLFLLTKSPRYYYDAAAITEPVTGRAHRRAAQTIPAGWTTGPGSHDVLRHNGRAPRDDRRSPGVTPKAAEPGKGIKANSSFEAAVTQLVDSRNKRSVWTVATQPYPDAHFATFPPKLIEPCILAGTHPGDLVLDPFFGAGTTGVVCRQHSRDYLGLELNAEYITMAEKRIAKTVQPHLWTAPLPIAAKKRRTA